MQDGSSGDYSFLSWVSGLRVRVRAEELQFREFALHAPAIPKGPDHKDGLKMNLPACKTQSCKA